MPMLTTFQGRPVKRMRQVPDGIMLTFVHPEEGMPGEQRTVSQADWDKYGTQKFVPKDQMPDLRELAARS